MPFEDIACHVWAIDGYNDPGTAAAVNSRYTDVSNEMFYGDDVSDDLGARQKRLEKIMRHCRVSTACEPLIWIIAYGGFIRSDDAAPAHMWIEYNGTIYETVPGKTLYSEPATPHSRQRTVLGDDYHGVASVWWSMTENQRSLIGTKDLQNALQDRLSRMIQNKIGNNRG